VLQVAKPAGGRVGRRNVLAWRPAGPHRHVREAFRSPEKVCSLDSRVVRALDVSPGTPPFLNRVVPEGVVIGETRAVQTWVLRMWMES
jgi:hypothetical protein